MLLRERARFAHWRPRTVTAAYGNTVTHFLRTFNQSTRTSTQRLLEIIKKLDTLTYFLCNIPILFCPSELAVHSLNPMQLSQVLKL